MTISKEQFEIFKQHFEIIETTKMISIYRVDLDYEDFLDVGFDDDDFEDDCLLNADYDQSHLMDIPSLIKKLVENLLTYMALMISLNSSQKTWMSI